MSDRYRNDLKQIIRSLSNGCVTMSSMPCYVSDLKNKFDMKMRRETITSRLTDWLAVRMRRKMVIQRMNKRD